MNTDAAAAKPLSDNDNGSPDETRTGVATDATVATEVDEDTDLAECTRTNIAAICAAMRTQQVDRFEVSYNGSGDDGQAEYPVAYDANNAEMQFDGGVEVIWRRRYRPDEPTTSPLEDAVQELLDEVLTATGRGGYENGEGGGGSFTITATGAIQLDHYDYVVETVDSTFTFALPTTAESAP